MEGLSPRQVRRLALARAGLLKNEWTGLPTKGRGRGQRARAAAQRVIERFGYLQIDSIPVTGARTHGIVLLSRLEGFESSLAEELLAPDAPLFEYWGHEASWLPMELYPAFEFRRREFRVHPWWGNVLGEHPEVARGLLERIERDGPVRSKDLEEDRGPGREMWHLKLESKVARALWSSGELAIRERRNFHRTFDLSERVIPAKWRRAPLARAESLRMLLLKALDGHGWATTGTLTATWRLRKMRKEITAALQDLQDDGRIVPCEALDLDGKKLRGWIRPADLELAARLERVRPRRDRGVLLSPFDPVLWDRQRVRRFFGFEQAIEIYKPAAERVYGYYCLPVLAGEELVGRVDLKADWKAGELRIQALWYEDSGTSTTRDAETREAVSTALDRYGGALGLELRA